MAELLPTLRRRELLLRGYERLQLRTLAKPEAAAGRPPSTHEVAAPLGCAVVRRVTDDQGRQWTVRELPLHDRRAAAQQRLTAVALLYHCAESDVRPVVRRSWRGLDALSQSHLRDLLQTSEC